MNNRGKEKLKVLKRGDRLEKFLRIQRSFYLNYYSPHVDCFQAAEGISSGVACKCLI